MPPARAIFWAATLAQVVFSVRAVLVGPPALPIAVVVVLAYVALLLAGVLVLRLRMFADALVHGPAGARGVALTFDDGPHPEHTLEVLDVLAARDARATFFVIGKKAEAHPDLVREIVRRGHAVGVHGYAHERFFALRGGRHVERDLARAVATLERITGTRPTLFRPPIGHTNPAIARIADRLRLVVVGWSVAGRDGLRGTRVDEVIARVSRGLEDGAIVLLHDAAERDDRQPIAASVLPAVLDAVHARNLTIVDLATWVPPDA